MSDQQQQQGEEEQEEFEQGEQPFDEQETRAKKKKKKKAIEISYEEYESIKYAVASHLQSLERDEEGGDDENNYLTWDEVIEWYLDKRHADIGHSEDLIEEMKLKTDLVIRNLLDGEQILLSVGEAPKSKKERGQTVLAVSPDYVAQRPSFEEEGGEEQEPEQDEQQQEEEIIGDGEYNDEEEEEGEYGESQEEEGDDGEMGDEDYQETVNFGDEDDLEEGGYYGEEDPLQEGGYYGEEDPVGNYYDEEDLDDGDYPEEQYEDEYYYDDAEREADHYTYEDLEVYAEELEKTKDILVEDSQRRISLMRLMCACCCCWVLMAVIATSLLIFSRDDTTPNTNKQESRVDDATPAPSISAAPSPVPSMAPSMAPSTAEPVVVTTSPTVPPSIPPSSSLSPTLSMTPTAAPSNYPTMNPTRDPNKMYFPVVADTYIRDGASSTQNFGSGNSLLVVKNSGFQTRILLYFNLTGLPMLEGESTPGESLVLRVEHIGEKLSYPSPKVQVSRVSMQADYFKNATAGFNIEDLTWDDFVWEEKLGTTITLSDEVRLAEFEINDLLDLSKNNEMPNNGGVLFALQTPDLSNPFGESFLSRETGEDYAPLVFYERPGGLLNTNVSTVPSFSCEQEPC